ncbi:hypothetical protein EY01_15030, partial [Staphylococcus aureus]
AGPQDRPARGVRGGPLRGVRLLRAGVPVPGPHAHAAPAHRGTPGDRAGRGAQGHRPGRPAAPRVRLRRAAD